TTTWALRADPSLGRNRRATAGRRRKIILRKSRRGPVPGQGGRKGPFQRCKRRRLRNFGFCCGFGTRGPREFVPTCLWNLWITCSGLVNPDSPPRGAHLRGESATSLRHEALEASLIRGMPQPAFCAKSGLLALFVERRVDLGNLLRLHR